MQRGKITLFAFTTCMALLAVSLVCAQPPAAEPHYDASGEWSFTPEPFIPGPGWLAEDPTTLYGPTPPPQDGWDVAYPFKYYPQGNAAVPDSVYDPSFLPGGLANECFCAPPPCYFGTFYLDALVLDRTSNIEAMDLYFNNANVAILNTADFNLDLEGGVRFGILLPGPTGNDWIGEYFGINSFQDSITRTDVAGVTDLFFGRAGGPFNSLTAVYDSKLDSLEFTIRSRQTPRLAPLAGIRYVRVDEEFSSLQDPVTRLGWLSNTDNDMYGFQFGCQALLLDAGYWRLETTAKAGPYLNDIDVDVRNNDGGALISRHADFWQTAFVGDLRIGFVCCLGARMNFRCGYQGLWIEGLAVAPNQNNNLSFATGLESVDVSGVAYQGGYLGLDLSW